MTLDPFSGTPRQTSGQRASTSSGQNEPITIDTFMAGIRRLESGSFQGNYSAVGRPVRGDRAIGAYQIMSRYWDSWASAAGIPGASWSDPVAQDHVARHVMQQYYDRFQNWDLVALAWYAGASTARKVLQRGYNGPESIQSAGIRQYVTEAMGHTTEAQRKGILPKQAYGTQPTMQQSSNGWVFPVAGAATWSQGSWMPNTKTHRGRNHPAVDIYAEAGTPIVAPVSGTVQATTRSTIGGYTARILGADGLTYYFAHMRDAASVGAGQKINAGQYIGFVGNSGSAASTSPHLHFSIRAAGKSVVNPVSFLEAATKGGGAFPGYSLDDFDGNQSQLGPIDPNGSTPKTRQGALTTMLTNLSDKIAGGSRDPSLFQKYGMVQDDYQSSTVETP